MHDQSGESLRPELKAALDKFVAENKVVLFMKGTRQAPQVWRLTAHRFPSRLPDPRHQCGFSNQCIQVLNTCGVPYETVNILEGAQHHVQCQTATLCC